MLGPEYWTALNHTVYFDAYGDTAEQAFAALLEALGEGFWYTPLDGSTLVFPDPEVIPEKHTAVRSFVVIGDSSATIAQRLEEAARRDRERPWLRQWATGLRANPEDVEMRARALVNLPDGRILDPEGPLGCIPYGGGHWLFFGFAPIAGEEFEDDEIDDSDA